MASIIDNDMRCCRCRNELDLAEMHYNEQEDGGGSLCDVCMAVELSGGCVGVADDGSTFFVSEGGVH